MKYYDSSRVISKQKNLNMIIGPRGYGKTYGYKRYCIIKAIKGEGKFIYMRRKKTEIDAMTDFFGAIRRDKRIKRLNVELVMKSGELYYYNIGEETEEDEKPELHHIGTLFALSVEATMKSREFDEYKYLIYDEWLPLRVNEFLPHEPKKFFSALDTVFRARDFQVFLIGNSSTLYNPYFEYFDFYPNIVKEFTVSKEKSMLVQTISSEEWAETREQTPLGQLIKGTDYEDYANKNEFMDNSDALVEDKPPEARNVMVFRYEGKTIGLWLDDNTGTLYFSEQYNPTVTEKYAFDFDEVDEDYMSYRAFFESPRMHVLQRAKRTGNIRFTSKKAKAHSKQITSKLYIL